MPAIGTVVAKNYLPFARVLAESIRRHHPDARLVVALADEPDQHVDISSEPFAVLTPRDLGVPDLRDLAFRTAQRELAIALKPFLIERLSADCGSALYLDADTLVLDSLEALFDDIRSHALTLVPHRLAPPRTSDAIERDLVLNLAGAFNAGVVGISRYESSRAFVRWWQMRVHRLCVYAVDRAVHYDQRWLDLALGFVKDLHVHRDVGVDVAHWNLPERPIRIQNGVITAAGEPCRLFHFSGFDPDDPETPTRYRPELRLDELGDAEQLFGDYARKLNDAGWEAARHVSYAYDAFDNGVRIPEVARRLYAQIPDRRTFDDPFVTDGDHTYFRWLTEKPHARDPNRLWLFVHSQRADLQRVFPHPQGRDRRRFLKWVRTHGVHEHGVPAELV